MYPQIQRYMDQGVPATGLITVHRLPNANASLTVTINSVVFTKIGIFFPLNIKFAIFISIKNHSKDVEFFPVNFKFKSKRGNIFH